MPIQSLGIFDSVFDWVCDQIFNPIVSWLGRILNSIFSWVINTIVVPVLKPVFEFVWDIIIVNIADVLFSLVYNGYCQMLWLVDMLQKGFDVLIGIEDITYTFDVNGVTKEDNTTLLEYFLNNDIVKSALVAITFIALALSMIFAIYAVMRSTLDFDFEGKRPVGRVMSSVAKTMIAFLLVPLIVVVGIKLASIILQQTCKAITGGNVSLGGWILAVTSCNAGKDGAQFANESGEINEPWAGLIAGETDYWSFGTDIHVSQIDYLIGFAAVIFMIIIMIMCLFTFIKRIFDIVLLYITSPYFVSTIVLDDGEKFKRWRETFIAKVLVGFGTVIGLRIFLMMIPVIMDSNLQIFDSVAGDLTGGYFMKLIFVLGGMFAVRKSATLLTGIISQGVAAEENMNNAIMDGVLLSGAQRGASKLMNSKIISQGKKNKKSDKSKSGNKFGGDLTAGGAKFAGVSPKSHLSDAGNEQRNKQAFGGAVAAALGKHNELDTSDYAPLSDGKENYLKDGVTSKTGSKDSAVASEDSIYAGVRDMFGGADDITGKAEKLAKEKAELNAGILSEHTEHDNLLEGFGGSGVARPDSGKADTIADILSKYSKNSNDGDNQFRGD